MLTYSYLEGVGNGTMDDPYVLTGVKRIKGAWDFQQDQERREREEMEREEDGNLDR
jgi:hypothetical protein